MRSTKKTNFFVRGKNYLINLMGGNVEKQRRTVYHDAPQSPFKTTESILPDNASVTSSSAYYRIWKGEPPVRGAVNVITNAICTNGYRVKTVEKGDVDADHPKVKQIEKWLSYPERQFNGFIRDCINSVLIYDLTFAEIAPHSAEGQGWMYALDTRDCTPVFSERGDIKQIIHKQGEPCQRTLNEDQFCYFSMDRMGSAFGVSALETLVRSSNLNKSAAEYNKRLFDCNGVPSMMYVLEEGSEEEWLILKKELSEQRVGSTVCLKGKVKGTPTGGKVDEAGYQLLVDQVYQDVMTVYNVPPALMARPGETPAESSREETNAFSMQVQSKQIIFNNFVDRIILKIWGEEYAEIRFELNAWINEKAQAAIDDVYAKNGTYYPNHILRRKGLPTVEWGDVPYNPNAPLGKGMTDPMELAQVTQQNQEKPPGDQSQASGGKPKVDRPNRQGAANDNEKMLAQLVEVCKIREQQLARYEEVIKGLTKIIELDVKAKEKIAKQFEDVKIDDAKPKSKKKKKSS